MIETIMSCPLGSKCEEIRDNKLYRCAWFTEVKGKNPQTGENADEKACAIAWLPILQIENANVNRGASDAIVSMREETIKRQDTFLSVVTQAAQNRLQQI